MPVDRPLVDNHGRRISYLRLAVTDRCNLRCTYCMPAGGIPWVSRNNLLSYEENERLLRILAEMGIEKVRITGGEPFARKDLIWLLRAARHIAGIGKISITTNGVLTLPFLPELSALGIRHINLSLDTLDEQKYRQITRRDDFVRVMDTFDALLQGNFRVKINAVIMEGINEADIPQLCRLAAEHPVHVRFIEEMPFNGYSTAPRKLNWNHRRILERVMECLPNLLPAPVEAGGTSENYILPGSAGRIGIIAAYSRNFCGTCNRLRITPEGRMRTCLYGRDELDLRALLRNGASDGEIEAAIRATVSNRARDGFEAEARRGPGMPVGESMAGIGG
jgi:molybdenum cofactor biosynthesis protein A